MFGALEIHGPYESRFDGYGNVGLVDHEYAWSNHANMLYIDNPVGAGYSYAKNMDDIPDSQDIVADHLYEFLQQFFVFFPEYFNSDFYAFGESYAGKFVPTIAKRIHENNQNASLPFINLKGIGIGDGFISPPESAVYAWPMYEASLVDEAARERLLTMEVELSHHIEDNEWNQAWGTWDRELIELMDTIGCSDIYNYVACEDDQERYNFEIFMMREEVRKALHAGNLEFDGPKADQVYTNFISSFMQSQKDDLALLLNNGYKALLYDGSLDIICNHYGQVQMINSMTSWNDLDTFKITNNTVKYWRDDGLNNMGYLTSVGDLRLFVMRNAGHMVPRDQPQYAQIIFDEFLLGML